VAISLAHFPFPIFSWFNDGLMTSPRQLLEAEAFRHLVSRRWRVSLLLTLCLFVLYYGYILLIALNKPLLAWRVGPAMPLGIPLGAAVIVGSWALTAVYIVWANRRFDPEAKRLRDRLTLPAAAAERTREPWNPDA
jgi:uncharacterized membrane protein (DUF485 family)